MKPLLRKLLFTASIVMGLSLLSSPLTQAQAGSPAFTAPITTADSTCVIESIGWIVCPVLRAAATIADYGFTFINTSFSQIEAGLLKQGDGISKAWSFVLGIANAFFVITFLVVVYSLITGKGVGNYDIKRMLPRFIIAAIMVNVSFLICQILVDISNIAGSGIKEALTSVAATIGPSGMPINNADQTASRALIDITVAILGKNSIGWILLAPLAVVVLGAAIICSALILILLARKTLVVVLVLIAPLAFVAFVLPNTEQYFSKWLKLFIQVLLIFPLISLLLGAGQIVSAAFISSGTATNAYKIQAGSTSLDDQYIAKDPAMPVNTSATLRLVAAGIAVLPLAFVWVAFKGMMQAGDLARAKLENRNKGRQSDKVKKLENEERRQRTQQQMAKGSDFMKQIFQRQNSGAGGLQNLAARVSLKSIKKNNNSQFEAAVQNRLNEIRKNPVDEQGVRRTPQELYSLAAKNLQNRQQQELEANVDELSNERVELRAAEAYMLENVANKPHEPVTAAQPNGNPEHHFGGQDMLRGEGSTQNAEGLGQASSPEPRPPQSTGAFTPAAAEQGGSATSLSSTGGAATSSGTSQPIIVQVVEGSGSPAAASSLSSSPAAWQERPAGMTDNEYKAKARAAKYMAESLDTQDTIMRQTDINNSLPPELQGGTVSESPKDDTTTSLGQDDKGQ